MNGELTTSRCRLGGQTEKSRRTVVKKTGETDTDGDAATDKGVRKSFKRKSVRE